MPRWAVGGAGETGLRAGAGWGGAEGAWSTGERVGLPGTCAHARWWLRLREGLGQAGGRGFLVTTYLDPRIPSGLQGERLRGN